MIGGEKVFTTSGTWLYPTRPKQLLDKTLYDEDIVRNIASFLPRDSIRPVQALELAYVCSRWQAILEDYDDLWTSEIASRGWVDVHDKIFFHTLKHNLVHLIPLFLDRFQNGNVKTEADFLSIKSQYIASDLQPSRSAFLSPSSSFAPNSPERADSLASANSASAASPAAVAPPPLPPQVAAAVELACDEIEQKEVDSLRRASSFDPAKPMLRCVDPLTGQTPLHFLAGEVGNLDWVKRAVALGCCVKRADRVPTMGWTPVHYAARFGQIEILKFLLSDECGADPHATDETGWTPLHVAAAHGQMEVVKLLTQQQEQGEREEEEMGTADNEPTAMTTTGKKKRTDINTLDSNGVPPLFLAVRFQQLEVVRHLLSLESRCDCVSLDRGATLLHAAVEGPLLPFFKHRQQTAAAATAEQPNLVLRAVLDKLIWEVQRQPAVPPKANSAAAAPALAVPLTSANSPPPLSKLMMTQTHPYKESALHIAVRAGDVDGCRILLAAAQKAGFECNGFPELRNRRSMTAVEVAIQDQQTDCAKLLLKQRGDCCWCCGLCCT